MLWDEVLAKRGIQINLAFSTAINKDVVRRILALHYGLEPDAEGPSWLTFLGNAKDSLWSLDLLNPVANAKSSD